jgi:hypothetical protein
MKVGKIIFLYAFLTLALVSLTQAQEWRRIVPLQSTRADVERLLGPAERSYGVVYELEAGNLSIEYSSGPCGGAKREGWNAPEETVISYSFSAKVKQRFADLKLNRKKFKKVKDRHVGVIDYYINAQEGIMYEVQNGEVDYVEYYPSRAYKHLYCGDSSATPSSRQNLSP